MAKRDVGVLSEESAVCRFRAAHGPRVRLSQDFSSGGRTKQSFKDECDINVVMRRYERTGVIPFAESREPRFLDCTGFDFQEAQLMVADARRAFADLPAGLRARFENDPARLLSFLDDDRNREEAVKLGLVNPQAPVEAPVRVEVVQVSPKGTEAILVPPVSGKSPVSGVSGGGATTT